MDELDLFRDFNRNAAAPSAEAYVRAASRLRAAIEDGDAPTAGDQAGRGARDRLRARLSGKRRLVVVLAVVAAVAVVSTSALAVSGLVLDKGFVGLPPEGAAPSTPESGELVLHWMGRSATVVGAPLARVWVYADGRVVWSQNASRSGQIPEGANELSSGYLEQRLTPDGVELLRSEVVGLLDRSRALLENASLNDVGLDTAGRSALFVPGDNGFSGVRWGSVEVREGDRFVRLQWSGISGVQGSEEFHRHLDDLRNYFDGTIATPEQVSDLRRIDALATAPASVLPPSAWAVREIRAYVPSYYEVCIDSSPPKDAPQLLSLLPTRAADVLRDKSRTQVEGGFGMQTDSGPVEVPGRWVRYCSKLTTEEARVVADGLSGLDQDPRWGRAALAYRVAKGDHDWEATAISFEPYFPHGQVTRSDSG
jgi:hypothetical protein